MRIYLRALTVLFNSMLYTSFIPLQLKACRTTLIPKGGDPVGSRSMSVRCVERVRLTSRVLDFRSGTADEGFLVTGGSMGPKCLNRVSLMNAGLTR